MTRQRGSGPASQRVSESTSQLVNESASHPTNQQSNQLPNAPDFIVASPVNQGESGMKPNLPQGWPEVPGDDLARLGQPAHVEVVDSGPRDVAADSILHLGFGGEHALESPRIDLAALGEGFDRADGRAGRELLHPEDA